MTALFSEDDWQRLTLLEKELNVPGLGRAKRWGAFPAIAHPDKIFFYPDLHFPFQDKLFLAYLDAKCDELKPTHIIIIGDLLDCYSLSDFDRSPSRTESFNDERMAALKWLMELRERHPYAVIIFIEGNHEERLRRQVIRKIPGLHDLPELTIPALLRFDELGIIHKPSSGFIGWGMRIKHGESTAKHAANVELTKHWTSGVSGHIHKKQEQVFTTGEGITHTWRSLGHCCDLSYADYVKFPNWNLAGGQMVYHQNGESEWSWLEG